MKRKCLLMLLVVSTLVKAQLLPYNNPNNSPSERATDLMNRNDIDRKDIIDG